MPALNGSKSIKDRDLKIVALKDSGPKDTPTVKPPVEETSNVAVPSTGVRAGAVTRGSVGVTKPSQKVIVSSPLPLKVGGGSKKTGAKGLAKTLQAPDMDVRRHSDGSVVSNRASISLQDAGLRSTSPGNFQSTSPSGLTPHFRPLDSARDEGKGDWEHLFFRSLEGFETALENSTLTGALARSVLPQLRSIRERERALLDPVKVLIEERGRQIEHLIHQWELVARQSRVIKEEDDSVVENRIGRLSVGPRRGKGKEEESQNESIHDQDRPEEEPFCGEGSEMDEGP